MEQGDATVDHQQPDPGSLPGESLPDPGLTEDRDTGDLVDPDAPDPIPEEVTDPADPSWVEPAPEAVPVDPDRLLPAYESPLLNAVASSVADLRSRHRMDPDPGMPPASAVHSPECVAAGGTCGLEAVPELAEAPAPQGHSPECVAGGGCGEESHCPPPYAGPDTIQEQS